MFYYYFRYIIERRLSRGWGRHSNLVDADADDDDDDDDRPTDQDKLRLPSLILLPNFALQQKRLTARLIQIAGTSFQKLPTDLRTNSNLHF